MMKFIGLNLGRTSDGKQLRDGGVALLVDNRIEFVLLEERISRKKRDGGFLESLSRLLESTDNKLLEIETIAISSCCERVPKTSNFLTGQQNNVISVEHHISHAIGTFALSPFNNALVIIIDAGGNTLEASSNPWWKQKREQSSYYLFSNNTITLIGRDFEEPLTAGFGEVFRAFTYFLGWKSSQHAGKTMALSAYGDRMIFNDKPIFSFRDDGKIISHVINNPDNPIQMVDDLIRLYGIRNVLPREPNMAFSEMHSALAAWIQYEMENVLCQKIKWLITKTSIDNICLSGGVAYNCKMNGEIANYFGANKVFIQPASGDHGQCLGNAIYAKYSKTQTIPKFINDPYLGPVYPKIQIQDLLTAYPEINLIDAANINKYAVELISQGNYVCRYNGRSEYGPRALGNRSILADPRNARNKFIMNKVKCREPFMPFAPSVLCDHVSEYFLNTSNENYMTTAVKSVWDKRKTIPAVIHKDGTSRIHIVTPTNNRPYYDLIEEFYKLTGIPMLLNTSFNRTKEPIVETHRDAFECFMNLNVDYLLIDGYLLEKSTKTQVHDFFVLEDRVPCSEKVIENNDSIIEEKYGHPVARRKKFNLYHEYIEWFHYGRKITTIRFKPNSIDYPSSRLMPMYATKDYAINEVSDKYVGHAEICNIAIKKFSELNLTDAINDGFANLDELKDTLTKIYGDIPYNSYVTIYHIYLNTKP